MNARALRYRPDAQHTVEFFRFPDAEVGKPAKIIYITDPKEARLALRDLKEAQEATSEFFCALDFETTGLFQFEGPTSPTVRLTCLSYKSGEAILFDHMYCGSFASFADDLMEACTHFYVFNSGFEYRWIRHSAAEEPSPGKLRDVGLMRKSVMGGGPLSLKMQASWDLEIELDKEEQLSDWTVDKLTPDQILYAATDATVTRALAVKWADEMNAGHWHGFKVLNEVMPATVECEETGLYLDIDYHKTLIDMWTKRRQAAEKAIRKLTDKATLPNIRSKKQISNLLKGNLDEASIAAWPKTDKTEQLQTDRSALRAASYVAPYPLSRWLAALMVFNRADKYLGTYGEKLITIQELSGEILGRFNIAAAVTGRFSSSNPNLQNIPRSPKVRRSFIARPGRRLVMADYSSIEVRVLAEIANDERLRHEAIYGDVHAASASEIYRIPRADFDAALKRKDARAKDLRSKAKAFTFQLLYGAGAAALSMALRTSLDKAQDAIEVWANTFPKAYGYRQYIFEEMNYSGFVPVKSGRTIYVPKKDRTMPVAANYPVQGAAGDVMCRAMYHTRNLLIDDALDCYLAAPVHDELLLDCSEEHSDRAKNDLVDGMTLGWLDIFPNSNVDNLTDAVIGVSWAEKP